MQKPEFEIRMSNGGISMPCALCEVQMQTAVGPEIFLKGTLDVVCPFCVKKHRPELVEKFNAMWDKYDKLKD